MSPVKQYSLRALESKKEGTTMFFSNNTFQKQPLEKDGFKSLLDNGGIHKSCNCGKAENEHQAIIKQARKRAEQIEKEAYEKGYHQGEKSGLEIGEKKLASAIASINTVLSELKRIKNDFYASHQKDIIALSLRVAKKVIHQEVSCNKETVISVVRAAIQCAIEHENMKIRLNPSDLELCAQKRPEIVKGIDGIKHIVFEPDENIGRGGAVIETDFGEIDARLEQQFEEIVRCFSESGQD